MERYTKESTINQSNLGVPSSISSGPALRPEPPSLELLPSSVGPSYFVDFGRPRQNTDTGRTRNDFSQPSAHLAPLVPLVQNLTPVLPQGLQFSSPPLLPLQDQTGSASLPGGPVNPHRKSVKLSS